MTITALLSELFQIQFKELNLKIPSIGSMNQTPIDLLRPRARKQQFTMFYGKPFKKWGQNEWSVLLQTVLEWNFLPPPKYVVYFYLKTCFILTLINIIIRFLRIGWLKVFTALAVRMYFCPQKRRQKCHALGRKASIYILMFWILRYA